MILTPRDNAILFDLNQYALLSTRALASRHFSGVALTTVLRRLRILEASGYIQRISCFEGGGNAWALAKRSAEIFAPAASKIHFPRFILDHDLKLTDLRLRLESVGIARSWRPEHEIRVRVARKHGLAGAKARTFPDGLMGIEVNGLQETVAVELELSPKNQDRYGRIFREYSTKENLWGIWYVVGSETLGNQLLKAARTNWHRDRRPYFLCTTLAEVMNDPLEARVFGYSAVRKLREIWRPKLIERGELPAHTPAQGVSRQETEISAERFELNIENETQMLTPAS